MALRSILVILFFAYTFFDYTESTSVKSGVTCQFKVFPNNPNLYYEIVYSGGYLVRQCHYGSKFSVLKCSCFNKTDTKQKESSAKKNGKIKEAQRTSKSGLASNKASQHIIKTKITLKKFSNFHTTTSTPASTTTTTPPPPPTTTTTPTTTIRQGRKLKKFAAKMTHVQSIVLSLGNNDIKNATTNNNKTAAFNNSKHAQGGHAANANKTKTGQVSHTAELAAEVLRSTNKSGLVVLDALTSREHSAEASSASNESYTSLSSEEEEPVSKDVTTKTPISINKTCALNAFAEDPTKYYELVPGHGYYIRDCAEGSAFSPVACGCTIHAKKEKEEKSESKEAWKKPIKEELPSMMQPPTIMSTEAAKTSQYIYIPVCHRSSCADDPTKYFEHVPSHGFYLRSCPKGTAFNPIHCRCSIHYGNPGRVILRFRNNNDEEEENNRNDLENEVADEEDEEEGYNDTEEEEEEGEGEEQVEDDDIDKNSVRSLLLNLLSAAEKKYGSLCHLQSFLSDATKYYNPIARAGHRVQHCAKGLVFKFEYCRCVRKKITIHWKKILPYIYI